MPKDNLVFKLDQLEYQLHYLQNTLSEFEPRFKHTEKLYNAKGKKSSKRVQKLLSEIKLDDVKKNCDQLKLQILGNKIFYAENSLKTFLVRQMNIEQKKKNGLKTVVDEIDKLYGKEKLAEFLVKSKLVKASMSKLSRVKKSDDWYQKHEYWQIYNDKAHKWNPSKVWTDIIMKTKKLDKLISILMNNGKSKEILINFNNGLDVILAVSKDKKQIKSNEEQNDQPSRKNSNKDESKVSNENESDSEDDSDFENLVDNSNDEADGMIEEQPELDDNQLDELLKKYGSNVAGSDDESDEELAEQSDIDYNQVTDLEESERSDSEDEQPQKKKQKVELPELMGGYYSGDEESDFEEDKIAKQQKSNKEVKKNRRGQRARRKIWEQKYGKQAKHIQNQLEKEKDERRRKQEEYEVRVAKRAAKAAAEGNTGSGSNNIALGTRKPREEMKEKPLKEDHPSWVAKKVAEKKMKNVKFQGKKISFD